MEKNSESLIRRLPQALSALTASILTNIIYDEISTSHFERKIQNNNIYFVEVSNYSIYEKLFFLFLLFSILWFLISMLIPTILKLYSIRKPKKKKQLRKKEILHEYTRIKLHLNLLLQNIEQIKTLQTSTLTYAEDISICINQLYTVFCPSSNIQKKVVKNVFRTGASISDIGHAVSIYEYTEIINEAKYLLDNVFSNKENELLLQDYSKLNARIIELKKVTNSNNQYNM